MEIKNCTTCFYGTFDEYVDKPCSTCSVLGNGTHSMWLDSDIFKEDEAPQGSLSITLHFNKRDLFVIKEILSSVSVSMNYHEPAHV